MILLPTASLQDILDVLENTSLSSRQFGINILNDMIRSNCLLSNSKSVDIEEPLEINNSALFPSNLQELLWDKLTIKPLIDYSKNFIQNDQVALAQLIAIYSWIATLADVYSAEHKALLPTPPHKWPIHYCD